MAEQNPDLNPDISPELIPEVISELLNNGKKLFEVERYTEAIAQLEQAKILINPQTTLGGEVQIWLANAYDAIGETKRAIAICRKLTNHSDPTINKQANYLISIFSAPELSELENVTSTLPNLTNLDRSVDVYLSPKSFTASKLSSNDSSKAIASPTSQVLAPVRQNYLSIWLLITLAGIIILSSLAILY